MKSALEIVQIIISITLITLVLLQGKSGGLGGIFGSDSGGVYKTRRGVEKLLFQATIGVAILFMLLSLVVIMI